MCGQMQFMIYAYRHTHGAVGEEEDEEVVGLKASGGRQDLSWMPDKSQRDLGGSIHIPSAHSDAHMHNHT